MPSSDVNGTIVDGAHSEEWSDPERSEIVEEANRILADPAFRNSRRCLAFFRYLLDRSLAGHHDGVKERTLGVEVFGRPPDYDTAIDPVVRMVANEIRKRLAQWYQEPTHHQRVRVRLTAGTYLLKFEFIQPGLLPELLEVKTEVEAPSPIGPPMVDPQSGHTAIPPAIPEFDTQPADIAPPVMAAARLHNPWIWGVAAIVIAALAAIFPTLRNFDVFQSRDYLAWKPLLSSTQPLTLSISDDSPLTFCDATSDWQLMADMISNRVVPGAATPQISGTISPTADAEVSQSITSWLAMHDQKSILRGSSAITLRDLRQGPVVLIGGFNPWSLVLLSNLRYSIRVDRVTHAMWIQDAQNTSRRDWMIDGNDQPKDIDYAVISRFVDAETGHWILSLGGMRQQGTQAATDLLIDGSFVELLPRQIKPKGNFQIVLKTTIINGSADPPQVLAVHTW